MKNKNITILVLVLSVFTSAQNIDSLYESFLHFKNFQKYESAEETSAMHVHSEKCGLGLISMVEQNYQLFSKAQQETITSLFARPELDTSFVTPKGYFRVHYDLTDQRNNLPAYDLDSLADALDYMYEYETGVLGYPPAPPDFNMGGDDLYDFYIQNQGTGYYGYTQPEASLGGSRRTCYSVIDNDFKDLATKYLDGAKVTVAHEYHHAIQIGNYLYTYNTEGYYYEISAVAMEEFVFDEINDYYHYMKRYYDNPYKMLSSNDGYNLGHWNLFLERRFGQALLIRIWELMAAGNESLAAMEIAVSERGSSFKIEFNTFGIWNYYTNYRANPELYFEEGANYPLIKPTSVIDFTPPKRTMQLVTQPVSNNYLQFNLPTTLNGSDTLFAIITNSDIFHGCCQNTYRSEVSYSLTTNQESGARKLGDEYYALLESNELAIFAESASSGAQDTATTYLEYVFPQPFKYNRHNLLRIPTAESFDKTSELYIFTTSMQLVYKDKKEIFSHNVMESGQISRSRIVIWDALDNDGNELPSGVYIYVTKADDTIKKGKLVIYHD